MSGPDKKKPGDASGQNVDQLQRRLAAMADRIVAADAEAQAKQDQTREPVVPSPKPYVDDKQAATTQRVPPHSTETPSKQTAAEAIAGPTMKGAGVSEPQAPPSSGETRSDRPGHATRSPPAGPARPIVPAPQVAAEEPSAPRAPTVQRNRPAPQRHIRGPKTKPPRRRPSLQRPPLQRPPGRRTSKPSRRRKLPQRTPASARRRRPSQAPRSCCRCRTNPR